jgi:hypothetical protein
MEYIQAGLEKCKEDTVHDLPHRSPSTNSQHGPKAMYIGPSAAHPGAEIDLVGRHAPELELLGLLQQGATSPAKGVLYVMHIGP